MLHILIINSSDCDIDKNSLEKGCGGSETWALQLANAFINRGNCVTICSQTNEPDTGEIYANKLNIVPINNLPVLLEYFKYDFIIVSRILPPELYKLLHTYYNSTNCIFYQFHDVVPLEPNYKDTMSFVNKVIALTPYHAQFLHKMTDIDYSRFAVIPNGIDFNLFNDIENSEHRDNRILWCSNPERGLYLILDKLYDDIKKEIPDFGIDIAYPNYSKLDTNLLKDKDVKILGSLSKTDLYKEMVKHKCWIYPQNFVDTFCIGMLEQAMSDVDIVCPWWYAPKDIFGDLNECYKNIVPTNIEYSTFHPVKILADNETNEQEYYTWIKNKTIDVIKNYNSEDHINKRNSMKTRIFQNYSWNNIAQLYENLYLNEKIQHGKL